MVNVGPTKATVVNVASLYQVNTGLVTVELEAAKVAVVPEQIEVPPVTTTLTAVALGLTTTVTILAPVAAFSQRLLPLTVT